MAIGGYDFNVYQPDIGNMLQQAQTTKNLQTRNALNQQQYQMNAMQMADYPAQQAAASQEAELTRWLKIHDAGLKAVKETGDPAAYKNIWKYHGYADKDIPNLTMKSDGTVKIIDGGITVEVPIDAALEHSGYFAENQPGEGPELTEEMVVSSFNGIKGAKITIDKNYKPAEEAETWGDPYSDKLLGPAQKSSRGKIRQLKPEKNQGDIDKWSAKRAAHVLALDRIKAGSSVDQSTLTNLSPEAQAILSMFTSGKTPDPATRARAEAVLEYEIARLTRNIGDGAEFNKTGSADPLGIR